MIDFQVGKRAYREIAGQNPDHPSREDACRVNHERFSMKSISLAATAFALALALTSCAADAPQSSEGDAAETVDLKVAVYGSGEEALIDIAEREGLFEEAGLNVEKVLVGAPPAVVAATQAGEVDIAMNPTIPTLTALGTGIPLEILGPISGYPAADAVDYDQMVILGDPDRGFDSMADLDGANIAVPARGAMFEVIIAASLEDNGIDPESINWIAMDFGAMIDALANGTVDAAPAGPALQPAALDAGLAVIGNPALEFVGAGATDLWITSNESAANNGDALRAFRDAVNEASVWANENVDEIKQMSIDITGYDLELDDVYPIYFMTEVNAEQLAEQGQRLVDLGFLTDAPQIIVMD